ncbi:asparagine synthase (glutamine-hydrolyzing) [Kitasatospora phosalacinea]|uniref:asparagine synthase (glutamine-hydrolyzing) n=1 Tax=Kitasatospora phosalacinea TaxID=2065 RepID=UPI0036677BAE
MCGLAGMARLGGGPLESHQVEQLRAMSRCIAHRGPDDEDLLVDGPVGLAFRRLSLVDPERGGQPFVSEDGTLALIANGEVYNHRALEAVLPGGTRMRTDSDCEVLLHLYRHDNRRFLDAVQGMFAVIVWDRRRGKLVLARDRFGIKPLYFHRGRDRIVVASEIKALFQDPGCPRRLDWTRALADQSLQSSALFAHGPVNTWFKGVEAVPAGTVMEFDLEDGTVTRHRYWELPDEVDHGLTAAEFIGGYGELLASSVEMCATADAELGLFLSGGIDSAAVAALASRTTPLTTFTAVNPGTFANGDAVNARRTADELGIPNHQILLDAARVPDPDEWRELLWLQESPRCGPEQFYKRELYRVAKDLRPELRGMLLGQASDEFNGGYAGQFGTSWPRALAAFEEMAGRTAVHRHPEVQPWLDHGTEPLLGAAAFGPADEHFPDAYHQYVRWKYRDVQQYNCWHEDRNAAGSGIEARVPFLDHRLVEHVLRVPPVLRERLLWDKSVLREAMRGVLPERVRTMPKVPFFYGSGERQVRRTFVEMLVQDGGILLDQAFAGPGAREFLNPEGIRATVAGLARDPGGMPVEILLRLVNLGLLEGMLDTLPPAPSERPSRDLAPLATAGDFGAEGQRLLAERMLPHSSLSEEAVLRLAEHVDLLQSRTTPGTWFLMVGGEIVYTVDESDPVERAWLALLLGLDEARPLTELVDRADAMWPDLEPILREALEEGVLTRC